MIKKFLLLSTLGAIFTNAFSAETTLSYPELDVTPRASERLTILAKKEKSSHIIMSQLPMQISALSTLTTGLMLLGNVNTAKDPEKKSPNAGLIVGTSWLAINYYVGQRYNMYQDTLQEVNSISGTTTRDQLMRERIAEEGINRAARMAVRLKWISVATNFSANAFMLSKVKKETSAQYVGAFSLAASFAPLLFVSEWEQVAADQNAYKKKVYGPIFTTSIFETSEGKFSPGLLLSYSF